MDGVGVYYYKYEVYNSKNKMVASKKYAEGITSYNWKATKVGKYKIVVTVKDAIGTTIAKTVKKVIVKQNKEEIINKKEDISMVEVSFFLGFRVDK